MSILNPSIPTTDQYDAESKSRRAGLLTRIFDAIVEVKTLEARRRIAHYLHAAGNQQLADLGFTAAEFASIRAAEPIDNILARRAHQTS